jgi:flagellar biosynthesis/type III secretory pathway protein FliH
MTLSDLTALRSPPVRTARVWQALDLLRADSSHNAFVRKSWSDTPVQAFAANVIKTWSPPGEAGDELPASAGPDFDNLPADAELSEADTAAATLALTEEALETERQAAFAKGLAEGQRQVRDEWHAEKLKNQSSSESIMMSLDTAVRRVIDTPEQLYEPLKRLALHLAEQLVLAELTVSPQAIERLVRRCVDELAPQRLAPVTVELNAADLAVLQAQPQASTGSQTTDPQAAGGKPAAAQWPWHLQASDDLLPGSVRASASDAVVSDLIENRLEVLARGLLLDSVRGMAQSAFQPSRMAARMAGERQVVDAQPRMTPAPAPTRSFDTPVMQDGDDLPEMPDFDSDPAFAPADLAERDLSAMDLPNLNLDDLDTQPDWRAPAAGASAEADDEAGPDLGQQGYLTPEADPDNV